MTLAVDRTVSLRIQVRDICAESKQSSQLVTGINGSSSSVQAGKNEQCRIYSYADEKFVVM